MATQIKVEIDPESYVDVYDKLRALYKMAEKIDQVMQRAQNSAQRIDYWFAFAAFVAGVCVGYFGFFANTMNR